MLSTSIVVRDLRKLGSDIIPLADFQETSLIPLNTTIHSQTICTDFGGLAKDLRMILILYLRYIRIILDTILYIYNTKYILCYTQVVYT